jgi:hypothetical protein
MLAHTFFFEDALIGMIKEIDFGWTKTSSLSAFKGVKERPETKEVIEAEKVCSRAICDSSKYYESFKNSGYAFL